MNTGGSLRPDLACGMLRRAAVSMQRMYSDT